MRARELTLIFVDEFKFKYSFQSNGVAEEQNFFAKSLPLEDLEKRKLLEKDGIFRKEARLYGTLMPKLIKYAGNLIYNVVQYDSLSRQNQYLTILIMLTQVHQSGLPSAISHVTI